MPAIAYPRHFKDVAVTLGTCAAIDSAAGAPEISSGVHDEVEEQVFRWVTLVNLGVYPFPVGRGEHEDNAVVVIIIIVPVLILAEEVAGIVLKQRVRIAGGPPQ